MLDTIFKEKEWQVIAALSTVGNNELFYSRHDCKIPGDRAWMSKQQRLCSDCGDTVPDSIQTLLTLLTWDKNDY